MFRHSIRVGLLTFLPLVAGLCICSAISFAHAATQQESDDSLHTSGAVDRSATAANVGDLKLRLEKGLKARRPEEFAFVALVVGMVSNDLLPLDLVTSTFLWARKKATTTPYPFPYFERALRVRAEKLGYDIPEI